MPFDMMEHRHRFIDNRTVNSLEILKLINELFDDQLKHGAVFKDQVEFRQKHLKQIIEAVKLQDIKDRTGMDFEKFDQPQTRRGRPKTQFRAVEVPAFKPISNDGPKVGSINLLPHVDFKLPMDADPDVFMGKAPESL